MASHISFAVTLLIALTVAVHGMSVPSETIHKLKDITVVKDIRNFAANHPGLRLTPLVKEDGKARSQSVRYSLGGRVQDDGLVAQGTDTYAYPVPNDVSLQLTYPESGTGAIVTYVEIITQQSNDQGNAYVVAGGIGQRFISIIIEAQETDYFSYKAQYFGVN